jgi:hypothetical protein
LPEHLPKNVTLGFLGLVSQKRRSYSKYSLALLVRVICFACLRTDSGLAESPSPRMVQVVCNEKNHGRNTYSASTI